MGPLVTELSGLRRRRLMVELEEVVVVEEAGSELAGGGFGVRVTCSGGTAVGCLWATGNFLINEPRVRVWVRAEPVVFMLWWHHAQFFRSHRGLRNRKSK